MSNKTKKEMMEYVSLGVPELRTLCRSNIGSGTWIAMANRDELVQALQSKAIPARFSGHTGSSNLEQEVGFLKAGFDAVGTVIKDSHAFIETSANEIRAEMDGKATHLKARLAQFDAGFSVLRDSVEKGLEEVRAACDSAAPSKPIEIRIPDRPVYQAGRQHRKFGELVQLMSLQIPVYLCGPAGSGKTEAGYHAAKALNLKFWPQSVCQQTSKADLLGYLTPGTGLVVRTPFREAYENGGVYLLDEIDAGNPNVTLILNAALSNGGCSFPDMYVKKHDDFRCIAAANTFGSGADRQYVGRNQIDAATLSRFAFIVWDYDEKFERDLAGDDDWVKYVQKIRFAVQEGRHRIVVSPRASINGAIMLKAGMTRATVVDSLIFGGVGAEVKKVILAKLGGGD